MLVRSATKHDIARVVEIHVASWRTAFRGIVPDGYLDALDFDERRRLWERVLSQHPGNLIVGVDGDAVQGFACSGPGAAELPELADYDGEIFSIHLDPARKGQGFGRLLMQASFVRMASAGCKGAHLWVFADNAPARAFYQRLGGEVVAQATISLGGRDIVELAYGWRALKLPEA